MCRQLTGALFKLYTGEYGNRASHTYKCLRTNSEYVCVITSTQRIKEKKQKIRHSLSANMQVCMCSNEILEELV